MRQQRIGGDVEGNAEEDVAAALIELARKTPARHIELHEEVAGRKRHLRDFGHVPGRDDEAARVGIALDLVNEVCDLIDGLAVGAAPTAPLHAVDGTEVAVFIGPLIPDANAVFLEIGDVGVALQEPEEFVNDRTKMKFLRRDERKTFRKIEAHLVAEHGAGACTRAVGLVDPVLVYVAHQGLVLIGDHGRIS